MALSDYGLFLYGYTVSSANFSLDFQAASLGPQITASLNYGTYSLTAILTEVGRAMSAADTNNTYTATADRTQSGGLQNRIIISTSGSHLSLLCTSGTNVSTSPWSILGFSTISDKTGSTSYTGQFTTGTTLRPTQYPYNYLSPTSIQLPIAITNMSTSGNKETLTYSIQTYWQLQVKYILESDRKNNWAPMMQWMMQGNLVEFTPNISSPTVFHEGWMEGNNGSSTGLGYSFKELLPDFPNEYDTGLIKFRVRPT